MMELEKICDVYSGYAFKSFNSINSGFPVVKIGNILPNGTLNLNDCVYTNEIQKTNIFQKKMIFILLYQGRLLGKSV